MRKLNVILRKCKSLSTNLGRSSSYSSLRSMSTKDLDVHHDDDDDDDEELAWRNLQQSPSSNDDGAVVFVGNSRRRYKISSKHLNHPIISTLIDKSSSGSKEKFLSVKCEVVLFDHLLWMLDNADLDLAAGDGMSLEELASLYVY